MKRWMITLTALAAVLQFSLAQAAAVAYTQAGFDKLMAEGKPVLVEVHADWCSTCRTQAPITDALLNKPELSKVTALRVDFDKQKDTVKAFNVRQQSTLIVFKGGKEVGRSIADTSASSIEALIRKAL